MLKQRLEAVEERIHAACRRSGRDRSGITLIAVTKVFPASVVQEAYASGLRDFGENYVQVAEEVASIGADAGCAVSSDRASAVEQGQVAAELFHVIQTVDTPKLARRLDAMSKRLEVMIEVKLSHEEAKEGAEPCRPSRADRCDPQLPESAACRTDDHASRGQTMLSYRGLISAGCANSVKPCASPVCPWACRTISKLPWGKAPPTSEWEPRFSADAESRDPSFLFAYLPASWSWRRGLQRGAT